MASSWPFSKLEDGLRELGSALDYPVADHVAFAVRRRLEEAPAPSRRGILERWRRPAVLRPLFAPAWQRVAVALVVLVAVLSGTLVFSPGARKAVAGWLGLRGVKIEVTPTPSLSPRVSLGGNLALGVSTTLQGAQVAVKFRVLVPALAGFTKPDAVDVIPSFAGVGQVSLLYRARPGLPQASATGVGLLLTEFQAKADETYLFKKVAPLGTTVESVTVNGEPGFWLSGALHEVFYVTPDGQVISDTVRLAGNVLLWQHGTITLRIEAQITKAQALAIARSVS